jgi:hypothetical protein
MVGYMGMIRHGMMEFVCLSKERVAGTQANVGFGKLIFAAWDILLPTPKSAFYSLDSSIGKAGSYWLGQTGYYGHLFLGGLNNVESCVSFAIVLLSLLMSDMYKER